MIKHAEITIDFCDETTFNQIIRYEHYLHRANSTRPKILYQFCFNGQVVALQEWSLDDVEVIFDDGSQAEDAS